MSAPDAPAVVELRQYTLQPGRRDALIELFDREFVETQEAVGIAVLGQFRDIDRADRFVWLRGFADMPARAAALAAFYGGRPWAAHRDAARATMVDTDDVLLLRPRGRRPSLAHSLVTRSPPDASGDGPGVVVAEVHVVDATDVDAFAIGFVDVALPLLTELGWPTIACYETEPSPNNFPPLPVRDDVTVFVSLAVFDDLAAAVLAGERRGREPAWRDVERTVLQPLRRTPTSTLRLRPTARSRIAASPAAQRSLGR